jgi:hypothetical protein
VKQGGARPSRARPAEVRRKVALSSFARIEPLICGRALLDFVARLSNPRPACPTVLPCDTRLLPNNTAPRFECGMSCRSAMGDDFEARSKPINAACARTQSANAIAKGCRMVAR